MLLAHISVQYQHFFSSLWNITQPSSEWRHWFVNLVAVISSSIFGPGLWGNRTSNNWTDKIPLDMASGSITKIPYIDIWDQFGIPYRLPKSIHTRGRPESITLETLRARQHDEDNSPNVNNPTVVSFFNNSLSNTHSPLSCPFYNDIEKHCNLHEFK